MHCDKSINVYVSELALILVTLASRKNIEIGSDVAVQWGLRHILLLIGLWNNMWNILWKKMVFRSTICTVQPL